ncbi:MAG: MazG nucleotide pyrophosphohydrolase domain-containing protein [Candidatus Aminicenantales bacterium]
MKKWTNAQKGKRTSHFDGISKSLPSLLAAFQIGQRVSHFGFDWARPMDAFQKVKEEVHELEEALESGKKEEVAEEVGDILFALANTARLLGVNPEIALMAANAKFIERFFRMEKKLKEQGRELGQASLEDMDQIWEALKKKE